MHKWYVFDEYDCFDNFETPESAALAAKHLVEEGLCGVHICYLTAAQFEEYCKDGNLKAAHKINE